MDDNESRPFCTEENVCIVLCYYMTSRVLQTGFKYNVITQNMKDKKDHFQDFGIDLENNIKMDRKGAGCIDLDQNRTVGRPQRGR
jgi:hypothetical protein